MRTIKFVPEGWNNEITNVNQENIEKYIENQEILQGLVKKCDSNYNLYVSFEDGLNGMIPRAEIEGINLEESGLPKVNLCTGKVHKFVQFKVKEKKEDTLILSRKEVQQEAINWIKNDLKVGEKVTRNRKKH